MNQEMGILIQEKQQHMERLLRLVVPSPDFKPSTAIHDGCMAVWSAVMFLLANPFDRMGVLNLDVARGANPDGTWLHFFDNKVAVLARTTMPGARLRSFFSISMGRRTYWQWFYCWVVGHRRGIMLKDLPQIRDLIRYSASDRISDSPMRVTRDYPDFVLNVLEELLNKHFDIINYRVVEQKATRDITPTPTVEIILAKGLDRIQLLYNSDALFDFHRASKQA